MIILKKNILSNLSKTPPWPFKIFEKSLRLVSSFDKEKNITYK